MTEARSIVVIGAGVVGMATALTLASRGHRVTVIDAAEGSGLGTSFANGAQLSYSYTDALASPAILTQLPRMLLGREPAFRLHATLQPHFLRWGLAFLRNATAERFRRNTLEGLVLALRSRTALQHLTARYHLRYAHQATGKIHLFRSEKSLAAARAVAEMKAAHGARQQLLGPDEAIALEPMLAAVRAQLTGALYTQDEEVGDPHSFCKAAARALVGEAGCRALFGTRVRRIDAGHSPAVVTDTGERISADRIILSAGVQSAALARTIGVRLPIVPMKGYSITAPLGPAAPAISITDVANRVVFARLDGRMRIAGLADLGRSDTAVEPRRLAALIAGARSALPEAADYQAVSASWAGLRPMTPNSLPIIQPIAEGVIANTGHGALGWTYAAGSAERVADIVEERG